ncbi:DUF5337 domain-containing protein [Antarctobacter sp.]|uniref:DUF5337 domain-containing protein n=1 Tax=Antarctobacter sp. TaxID=1872577 RepID=UPI002B26F7F8|nr:DUF5337 domain-containing protein [Antarctobacter sp.]
MADQQDINRRGRVIALVIAGTGVGWIAATAIGGALDWSQRLRALFDLAALGGFVWALWMVYGLWRDRQKDKD